MNKLFKTLLLLLVLIAMPMKHWAQTPYRQYSDEGVVLNFHSINNVYFRSFLLYSISNDDRFALIPEETYGQFIITSKDDDNHFMDEFENFYADVETDFSMLSKIDVTNLMGVWKSSVEATDYLSIMMDVNTSNMRADNDHCLTSMPFCTSEVIEFEAAYQGGASGEPGPEYGCLSSQPYPSWYHMRIHTAGQFIIHMEAHDNYGQGHDIDYCIWGPFSDPYEPCVNDLTCDKLVDCSYSTASVEDVYLGYNINQHHHTNLSDGTCVENNNNPAHVPEVGEYYILVITNYAQVHQTISFTKAPNSGPGETDCDILPGIVSNDGPYCEGETIHLTVNDQPNATYLWEGPDGWTSDLQNPIRTNCTMEMAGEYRCTTTVGTQHVDASTNVQIYQQATPSFTANTVCQGEPTQFNGQSTANDVVFEWDFGDDQTGTGQNPSHTYAQAGTYDVTLHIEAEDGSCPADTTQTVIVDAMPYAGNDTVIVINYGEGAPLISPQSNYSFTYNWSPGDKTLDSLAPNTQTTALTESLVYTLTITNPEHLECTDSKQVSVRVEGGALYADIEAEPDTICRGDTTRLTITAYDGTHQYIYSWEHDPSLDTASITVTPTVSTEYRCKVEDGQTEYWTIKKKVVVNQPDTLAVVSISGCDSIPFVWEDGQGNKQPIVFYEDGDHTFVGLTEAGCYREQTYHIEDMQYTPEPEIVSLDEGVDPHYVITATEFNVNRYNYSVEDLVSDIATWHNSQCRWEISKKSWRIEPSEDNLSCLVYPMDWSEDTVWLSFKAVNDCTGEDGVIARFWLKPSYYGVEDNETNSAWVNVIPNPNNGQMELRLENMEGRVDVKVYNAVGTPIDHFEIKTQQGPSTYFYTMKQLSNGVYFFVFTNGKKSTTKKVVIIQ